MGILYRNIYFFATTFSQFTDIVILLFRIFPTFSGHIAQIGEILEGKIAGRAKKPDQGECPGPGHMHTTLI